MLLNTLERTILPTSLEGEAGAVIETCLKGEEGGVIETRPEGEGDVIDGRAENFNVLGSYDEKTPTL
jgi:hypothetical protein